MTTFEIIILAMIYLFCYGYTIAMFIKEESIWFRTLLVFVSLALALYAPLFIGGAVFKKLNDKRI